MPFVVKYQKLQMEAFTMIYELMTKKHLKTIEKLQQEWVAEDITYGVAAGTIEQLEELLTPYCFVVKNEQEIIGYLMAEAHKDNEFCIFPIGASYIEVYDLFVTKKYRASGFGKKLLQLCEEKAAQNGIKQMLLSSATKDADTIRDFYTQNDYKIWTTQFFKTLD